MREENSTDKSFRPFNDYARVVLLGGETDNLSVTRRTLCRIVIALTIERRRFENVNRQGAMFTG